MPGYDELRAAHRWALPERLNLGVEVADRQPRPRPAILVTDGREITRTVTFGELSESSNRLANALAAPGVAPGDRVAIMLSQRPETAIAHIAAYKLGAIAVPLSTAFGPDALEVRLRGSEPRALLARAGLTRAGAGARLRRRHDRRRPRPRRACSRPPRPRSTPHATTPDTPALLVFTSGTTGAAEGRAPRAPRPRRPPAGLRALARLLPAAGRPDLDAGRLGVDRRALRRPDAGPRPRDARRRVPRAAVRPRAGVRRDRPMRASATSSCRRPRCG